MHTWSATNIVFDRCTEAAETVTDAWQAAFDMAENLLRQHMYLTVTVTVDGHTARVTPTTNAASNAANLAATLGALRALRDDLIAAHT